MNNFSPITDASVHEEEEIKELVYFSYTEAMRLGSFLRAYYVWLQHTPSSPSKGATLIFKEFLKKHREVTSFAKRKFPK